MNGKRNGFTLVEMVVTTAVLAVLFAGALPVFSLVAVQVRNAGRRTLAAEEAANLMERVALERYDLLSAQSVGQWQLAEATQRALPGAELKMQVDATSEAPPGKRVSIEITWLERAGQRSAPVRLVAWRYPTKESSP